jgi:predicted RNA methylase
MDNNFLLTYYDMTRAINTFQWFESEEEMDVFIDEQGGDITVIEAVEILDCRQILP